MDLSQSVLKRLQPISPKQHSNDGSLFACSALLQQPLAGAAEAHQLPKPPSRITHMQDMGDFRPPRAWHRLCSCFTQQVLEITCSLYLEMGI